MDSPVISWCRHCGLAGPVTREHVPPHSTNNDGPVGRVVDHFDLDAAVQEVAEWEEGHVVSTLCLGCNNRASRWGYVKEYRRWFELFLAHAKAVVLQTNTDPLRGASALEIELPHDVQPARFVRQVLGMLLAVQATEHILAAYPALAELIGPDPSDGRKRRRDGLNIAPLRLYMSVCNAKWSYSCIPMLAVEIALGTSSPVLWAPPSSIPSQRDDVVMLCVSPFTFILTTKAATNLGRDISDWTSWSVDRRPVRTNGACRCRPPICCRALFERWSIQPTTWFVAPARVVERQRQPTEEVHRST